MADDTDDGRDGRRDRLPDEAALSARLGRLDQRLSEFHDSRRRGTDQPGREGGYDASRGSALARGFRLSSELIAGVLVGALIGWAVDRLFSTSPFGLIVFFLLGFAAGIVNVVRAASGTANRTGS